VEVSRRCIGKSREGEDVEEYSIRNSHGLAIRVITFGGTLVSVTAPDRDGVCDEITLGFDELSGYLGKHPYFGATIGRYANRIAHGRFRLDGKEYELFCNKGAHHLHGGRRGFDHVMWKASSWQRSNRAGVDLGYVSPDGEEGYPGSLSVRTAYALDEGDELEISYEATADRATPVNLTNHTYWNLGGAGTGDITGHLVTLFADQYLPVDSDIIPTGEIASVAGTAFDFRSEKRIGDGLDIAGGYDHCFVIRTNGTHDATTMRPAARVSDPVTGRGIEISTTQPGIQFYTGNGLAGIIGRGGKIFSRHTALCLETEGFPDAVNRSGFPNQILRPGERYQQSTKIRFYR
jgi:aldose 1-epimerase